MFSKIGDYDSAILSFKENVGKTGSYYRVNGPQTNLKGVQIGLDNICNPEYTVSVSLKSKQNSNICLSMQYSYLNEIHYANLFCTVNKGEWADMKEYNLLYPQVVMMFFFILKSLVNKMIFGIDDFSLKIAPSYLMREDVPSLKDI